MRPSAALVLALTLVTADFWLKSEATTPSWAYHERDLAWVALCLGLIPFVALVLRIPSPLMRAAAAMLLAGIVGNLASALSNGLLVPNPIVVRGANAEVAFNLADVYAIVGIVVLIAAVCTWLIQQRSALAAAAGRDATTRRESWGSGRPLT